MRALDPNRPRVPRGHRVSVDEAQAGRELALAAGLVAAAHEVEQLTHQQVVIAREAGATWQQIGDVLGMTAKSAWKRYVDAQA